MEIMTIDTYPRLSAKMSPYKYTQRHSNEGCIFSLEKTYDVECWKPIRMFLGKAILWK